MRRRIYIDPESDLEDITGRPWLYAVNQDVDEPLDLCRIGTLTNDELWANYQEAVSRVRELACAIHDEMRNEPFDETEKDLHARAQPFLRDTSDYSTRRAQLDAISADALAHARSVAPSIEELLAESSEPYTRERFDADLARVRTAIATKHGIAESEVHALVAEHRYRHSDEDIEDEYIKALAFGRHAGWV